MVQVLKALVQVVQRGVGAGVNGCIGAGVKCVGAGGTRGVGAGVNRGIGAGVKCVGTGTAVHGVHGGVFQFAFGGENFAVVCIPDEIMAS